MIAASTSNHMTEIPVSGQVLAWARNFRGLSLERAAERLGISTAELEEFESEVRKPTLTKFEKIAATYQLPLATLFRRTPPPEPGELPDFRTFEGAPPQMSFEFRVALSKVRSLQAKLRVLRSEDDRYHVAALRQYDLRRDPYAQGEIERERIGISVQRQLDWNAENGFRHWRAVIERFGIAVYLQKFDLNDCRGCSLWDDGITPAIIINKAERSENAWVFTLIHEYAHLLVRRPGISDLNRRNPVEAFCNRFAAAFLMPIEALRRLLPEWPAHPIDWQDTTIREVSRQLKLSAQALAIRLEELGRAEVGFHRRFAIPRHPRQPTSGGDYVRTRLSELGGHFTSSVMSALDRDIIDSVHASEALGLNPPRLDDARAYVARQRELALAK
jgi:Zn-dependent peptidase ImmA (M78 family)/DNA-binding XRE family transcriptional regulator